MRKSFLVRLTILIVLLLNCFILTSCYSIKNKMVFIEVDGGCEVTGASLEDRFYKSFVVKIPDEFNGSPVVSIGYEGFIAYTSMISIKIPDTVTNIGPGAFAGCFLLTKLDLPENLNAIGNMAFSGCTSLKNVEIPDGTTTIGDRAFLGCKSLKSITIPDSVTFIGEEAFSECTSLQSITVSENNENYKSIDGCLYTKDGKTLLLYPSAKKGKSFEVPDGVTEIADSSCAKNKKLKEIIISNSVVNIGQSAFSNCKSLKTVVIGDNVTYIEKSTFFERSATVKCFISNFCY